MSWPFGHLLTWKREHSLRSFDEEPDAYLDPSVGEPYRSTYDLALVFPVVARIEGAGRKIAHVDRVTYVYRRWERNDDATNDGLAYQTLCARKISLYWLNKQYRKERQER